VKALATSAAVLGLLAAAAPVQANGNGGVAVGGVQPKPTPAPAKRPLLAQFSVAPLVLTPGATPTVKFLVNAHTALVRLRLVVGWPGTTNPPRVVDLGRRPAGSAQSVDLPQLADPALPEGVVSVRIAGRDTVGRLLRPAAHLSRVVHIQIRGHVFPLQGTFSYGGPDARFGAARDGHTHQGQDLLAAEGTTVVAVRSGTIEYVGYQDGGAGWYVVLDGDGEEYDYAYMHLQEGSITVVKGQHVMAGQRIAAVGHTGDATVSHLHFEVWQGPWFAGGQAIDPLPFLQTWQAWSDAQTLK
jgi:murein DD-endopeptidase MepM/ murein hydrolase activator NlpD